MTVVAAIARHGRVYMTADTASNYSGTLVHGAVKIRPIPVGDETALLAASGNGALLSVLQRDLTIAGPPTASHQEWADAIATAATEVLNGQGPPLVADGHIDGALLMAFRDELFYLFTHHALAVPDGVAALGSGCDVAIGAMRAALQLNADPREAVTMGVQFACEHIDGCHLFGRRPQVLFTQSPGVP